MHVCAELIGIMVARWRVHLADLCVALSEMLVIAVLEADVVSGIASFRLEGMEITPIMKSACGSGDRVVSRGGFQKAAVERVVYKAKQADTLAHSESGVDCIEPSRGKPDTSAMTKPPRPTEGSLDSATHPVSSKWRCVQLRGGKCPILCRNLERLGKPEPDGRLIAPYHIVQGSRKLGGGSIVLPNITVEHQRRLVGARHRSSCARMPQFIRIVAVQHLDGRNASHVLLKWNCWSPVQSYDHVMCIYCAATA